MFDRAHTRRASAYTVRVALFAVAAFTVTIATPTASEACSMPAPPPELVGYPAEGATEVPTDVVPIFDTIRANITQAGGVANSTFELRSAGGALVPVDAALAPYTWQFELTPQQSLEPNTTYTLVATLYTYPNRPVTASVGFTTGAGPAAPAARPSDVFIQNYRYQGPINTCGPSQTGTCVAIPSDRFVVIRPTSPFFPQSSYLLRSSEITTALKAGMPPELPPAGCLEIRTRSPNGSLSEAVLRCAEWAPLLELPDSNAIGCTSQGLTKNGEVVSPNRGCSMSPTASGGGMAGLAGLLLSFAALRLKRRSKR